MNVTAYSKTQSYPGIHFLRTERNWNSHGDNSYKQLNLSLVALVFKNTKLQVLSNFSTEVPGEKVGASTYLGI